MFRQITLAGDARTRGEEHGRQLAAEIGRAIEIYLRLLPQPASELERLAGAFRAPIAAYSPQYCEEIEAIAAGAGVPPWQIYLLNARTELLHASASECTALYLQGARVLGQNWDWLADLEPLCVIATVLRPDGHCLVTFTEPGMLAKIGMNNRGVGVCLNILDAPGGAATVPVHVVLRAALDADDLWSARQQIERAGLGKASHLLLADDTGACCGFEFAPEAVHELPAVDGVLLHTNHYLAEPERRPRNAHTTTFQRYDTAAAVLAGGAAHDLDTLRAILLDASQGPASINSPYREREDFAGMAAGTVASVIMDLPARRMQVSRGNDPRRPFASIGI